jgi:hypothetical protein
MNRFRSEKVDGAQDISLQRVEHPLRSEAPSERGQQPTVSKLDFQSR